MKGKRDARGVMEGRMVERKQEHELETEPESKKKLRKPDTPIKGNTRSQRAVETRILSNDISIIQ